MISSNSNYDYVMINLRRILNDNIIVLPIIAYIVCHQNFTVNEGTILTTEWQRLNIDKLSEHNSIVSD